MELDWQALARGNQTLAIYMGTVKAAKISEQLIQFGRAENTLLLLSAVALGVNKK